MEVPMPTAESLMYYTYAGVYGGEDAKDYCVYLIPGEEYIDTLADEFRSWGYDVTGWEYGEYDWGEETEANSYLIHVVDQYGDPVPGVAVNFCTDDTCTMRKGDENGTITFEEEPGIYHLQILKVPEGYSFDADYEFYTGEQYSEWRLRIKKD